MSNIENFVKLKNESIKILTQLKNESSKNELSQDLIESIEATIDSINSDKFTVAVVGVIKRGKSTLLNALLKADKDILSTNVNPETARLSVLSYDEKPRAVIYTLDNKKIDISLDELPKYTSSYNTIGCRGERQKVINTKFAQIFYPNEILKQGFEIVDTPGVEDPDESRLKVTFEFIDKSDVAIFLMNASEGGLKDIELKFLKSKILNNPDSSKGIVFVLNKIGQLRRRQLENELPELIKKNESLLQNEFGLQEIKIFRIDALEALKVYRNEIKENEAKFLKQFEELREHLSNYLVREKGKIFLKLRINKFIIENLNQKIQSLEKLILEKQRDINEIEKQPKENENRLDELEKKLKLVENSYKYKKDYLKYLIKGIINDEFNRIINFNKEAIKNFNKNLSSTVKNISSKINPEISGFINDLIDEFDEYNLNISKPDFNIPLKQLNMSEFYNVQRIKHEARREGEMLGKAAGALVSFLIAGPNPQAIYWGYKLGGEIGSQFNEQENVETKVNINYERLKSEIKDIREQIISYYHQEIDLYFNNTIENIKVLVLQEKRSIESNYKANKKAYNMKTEEFENYIRELNDLIKNISNYKKQLERILLELEKL